MNEHCPCIALSYVGGDSNELTWRSITTTRATVAPRMMGTCISTLPKVFRGAMKARSRKVFAMDRSRGNSII
jgi:hypothetical protein